MNALFYLHQTLIKHGKPTYNQHINDKKKMFSQSQHCKNHKNVISCHASMEKQC